MNINFLLRLSSLKMMMKSIPKIQIQKSKIFDVLRLSAFRFLRIYVYFACTYSQRFYFSRCTHSVNINIQLMTIANTPWWEIKLHFVYVQIFKNYSLGMKSNISNMMRRKNTKPAWLVEASRVINSLSKSNNFQKLFFIS